MQSFNISQFFHEKVNNIFKSKNMTSILSNPIYIVIIIVIIQIILYALIMNYKDICTASFARFIFYFIIIITLLQLTNNYIINKEISGGSIKYQDKQIMDRMDDPNENLMSNFSNEIKNSTEEHINDMNNVINNQI
jgi:purine-cytosine permease-like protein